MKLSYYNLVCSTDRMLAALGLNRTGNAGWLQDAMRREFSAEQIKEFERMKLHREQAREWKNGAAKRDREKIEMMERRYRVRGKTLRMGRSPVLRNDGAEAFANALYESCWRDLA